MTSRTNVNCNVSKRRLVPTTLTREDRKHIQSDFDPTSSCTAETC